MLLGEPLDGAGKRLSGNVGTAPARSVTFYEAALHVKAVARRCAALNR
jgi:hypothetical protein